MRPSRRLLALAPLLLAGCTQAQVLGAVDALTADSGAQLLDGAAFGPDPRQRLDLYAPPGARDRPAVLFLYGGSWRQGARAQYRFVAESLVARGFVVLVADYRLAPPARFPAFVEDAALAMAWAQANLARHGGDPARLAVLGHSAGAYNALVAALDPRFAAGAGLEPGAPARIVALAPPTGEELKTSRWLAPVFAGADPPASAWPIDLAQAGARAVAPITLVAGEADTLVRADRVRRLGAALAQAGNQAETLVLEDAGHLGVLADLWLGNARAEPWIARLSA